MERYLEIKDDIDKCFSDAIIYRRLYGELVFQVPHYKEYAQTYKEN